MGLKLNKSKAIVGSTVIGGVTVAVSVLWQVLQRHIKVEVAAAADLLDGGWVSHTGTTSIALFGLESRKKGWVNRF